MFALIMMDLAALLFENHAQTLSLAIFDVLPEGQYVAMKWLRLTPVILMARRIVRAI